MAATTTTTMASTVKPAFFAALNVAAITSTLGCRVSDWDSDVLNTFPVLRIAMPSGIGWPTVGRAGRMVLVQLSVFAQGGNAGIKAQAILDKAMELRPYTTVTDENLIETGDGADEVINNVKTIHRWVRLPICIQEAA